MIYKKIRGFKRIKAKGSLDTYFATIVSITMLMVLMVALFFSYETSVRVDRVVETANYYRSLIQRNGCLTDDDKDALIADLESLGVINIDLAGTSRVPVGYANKAWLKITCDVPSNKIDFTKGWGVRKVAYTTIHLEKYVIAYY